LGKPAILVEHHEFFRNGPGGVEKFVAELARVRPGIRWTSLAETARRTHQRRRLADHRHAIQFFTDEFEMETELGAAAEYVFSRRLPETPAVRSVSVNGARTDFAHRDGRLSFTVASGASPRLCVRVEVERVEPAGRPSRGLKYHAGLALRRGLSEFRDNVIAKNDFALRAAKSAARKLKQTGNS
jgi:hypothetical protein